MYSQQQYGHSRIGNSSNHQAIYGNSNNTPNNVDNGTWVQQGFQTPGHTVQPIHNMPTYEDIRVESNGYLNINQFNQFNMPGKRHFAQISFTNRPNGGFVTHVVKRKLKRKRTIFTTAQVEFLESIFLKKPYVNREERLDLEGKLRMNEKAIKVWFQNRRLKEKREAAEWEEEMNSPVSLNLNSCRFDRLSYVETLMSHPDEKGYVTLDNRALNDLAAVIHDILPKDILLESEVDHKPNSSQAENKDIYTNIYEPVSPAATDNPYNDEIALKDFLDPKESLQQLLQSI